MYQAFSTCLFVYQFVSSSHLQPIEIQYDYLISYSKSLFLPVNIGNIEYVSGGSRENIVGMSTKEVSAYVLRPESNNDKAPSANEESDD